MNGTNPIPYGAWFFSILSFSFQKLKICLAFDGPICNDKSLYRLSPSVKEHTRYHNVLIHKNRNDREVDNILVLVNLIPALLTEVTQRFTSAY